MSGLRDNTGTNWTICKQSTPGSRQIATLTPHHSFFTDRVLFLTPNQQCQSAENHASFPFYLIMFNMLECISVAFAGSFNYL